MSKILAAAIVAAVLVAPGFARADAGSEGRTVVVGNAVLRDGAKSPELSRSLEPPLSAMSNDNLNAQLNKSVPLTPFYSIPEGSDRGR